jgi:hypothetical protein
MQLVLFLPTSPSSARIVNDSRESFKSGDEAVERRRGSLHTSADESEDLRGRRADATDDRPDEQDGLSRSGEMDEIRGKMLQATCCWSTREQSLRIHVGTYIHSYRCGSSCTSLLP